MVKKFHRQSMVMPKTSYVYKPNSSLKDEEKRVYRRLGLSLLAVIALVVVLYVWGTNIVAAISNAFGSVFPSPTASVQITPADGKVIVPVVDALPLFTKEAVIDIKGWAQEEYEAMLFRNDVEIGRQLVDKSGRFEFSGVTLFEGENVIYASAVFKDQTSDPSTKQIVTLDTKLPELTFNLTAIDQASSTINITGETDPDNTLFINERRVIIQSDSKFSDTFSLVSGENTFKFNVEDAAGNTKEYVELVNFDPTILPTETPTP